MRAATRINRPMPPTIGPTDIVDLLLIRSAFYNDGTDLSALRAACTDLFAVRAADVASLEMPPRDWPPIVIAHDHWHTDFEAANGNLGLDTDLLTAVDAINNWIALIDAARPSSIAPPPRPV